MDKTETLELHSPRDPESRLVPWLLTVRVTARSASLMIPATGWVRCQMGTRLSLATRVEGKQRDLADYTVLQPRSGAQAIRQSTQPAPEGGDE